MSINIIEFERNAKDEREFQVNKTAAFMVEETINFIQCRLTVIEALKEFDGYTEEEAISITEEALKLIHEKFSGDIEDRFLEHTRKKIKKQKAEGEKLKQSGATVLELLEHAKKTGKVPEKYKHLFNEIENVVRSELEKDKNN